MSFIKKLFLKNKKTKHVITMVEGNDKIDIPMHLLTKFDFGDCPVCGSKLCLDTATEGENAGEQFYECSNYPKCKYKKHRT